MCRTRAHGDTGVWECMPCVSRACGACGGGHSGNCQIWGKKAEKIQAQYVTADGEVKKSLLLLSGWWGLSRHFHYIPEWMAAFAWTAPTLYDGNIVGCASLLPRPPAPAHLVIFSVFPCISFS